MKRFFHGENGTTLTELVIALPMMMICLYGIIELSKIATVLNVVEARGAHAAMTETLESQRVSMRSAIGDPHSNPATASLHAMRQLNSNPPRQPGAARHFLVVSEMSNYSFGGLALSGHLGESYARTRIPRLLGAGMAGVDGAATSTPRTLAGTSMFATQLFDDSPGQRYQRNTSEGYLDRALSILNTGLDHSGGRSAFAAGIRYGTETGSFSREVGSGRFAFRQNAYYTLTVAPYTTTLGRDGVGGVGGREMDALRAIAVSRVTMTQHAHYNEIMGFNGLQNSRDGEGGADVTERIGLIEGSHIVDGTQIQTPTVERAGFVGTIAYDNELVRGDQ